MAHKRMKLKSKKKKGFFRFKHLVYLTIIYFSFAYTFYYMIKDNKTISNEEFINILVSSGNANILSKYKFTNVVNTTMKVLFNIDFRNPPSILNSSILKFSDIKKYEKVISLEYNDDYSNMDDLKSVSEYIKDPNPSGVDKPIIYLYNTHQLENYNSDNLDIYGITPNVQMASYVLRELLKKKGIESIVEEANMSKMLEERKWDYSYSYKASGELINSAMNKYSSLKYFIDIHRDSVGKNISTVTIGGKDYAKVLFIIGLDHSNWQVNYNFASKLNNLVNDSYNGLSRGILKKTGMNVNGIYNQDVSPNCILIEVGGVDNTSQEVYNTMEVIADVLDKYIKENG